MGVVWRKTACVLETTIVCSTVGITRCSGREQWVWSGGDHWVQSNEKLKLWLTGDQWVWSCWKLQIWSGD